MFSAIQKEIFKKLISLNGATHLVPKYKILSVQLQIHDYHLQQCVKLNRCNVVAVPIELIRAHSNGSENRNGLLIN